MQAHPPVPPVRDAPAGFLERGHLWIEEFVCGAALAFAVDESGHLVFGADGRPFDGDPPWRVRHATDHVRRRLDWESVTADLDRASDLVFAGVATTDRGVAYDWDRTPPLLVHDVYDDDGGEWLPPDLVAAATERVGLATVPTVRKEQPAKHFDPDGFDRPESALRDGPVAGVVLRNKRGERARIGYDGPEDGRADVDDGLGDQEDGPADADALADRLVTGERVDRALARLDASHPDPGTAAERVVATVFREADRRIEGLAGRVDREELAAAVSERAHRAVRARRD
ncbi:MAG: RNA ligase family protein [Halobacteriaceae archaeon]